MATEWSDHDIRTAKEILQRIAQSAPTLTNCIPACKSLLTLYTACSHATVNPPICFVTLGAQRHTSTSAYRGVRAPTACPFCVVEANRRRLNSIMAQFLAVSGSGCARGKTAKENRRVEARLKRSMEELDEVAKERKRVNKAIEEGGIFKMVLMEGELIKLAWEV